MQLIPNDSKPLQTERDVDMPNEQAPAAPVSRTKKKGGNSLGTSTSSSSTGSSRNTRPPSYNYVMDNQDDLGEYFSMKDGTEMLVLNRLSTQSEQA